MIYTEEQLFTLIKPMLVSGMKAPGNTESKAVHMTQAIITLILQDRKAHEADNG